MISLKRHERPDEFVERNFLPEFHRRLYASFAVRRSFFSRVRAFLEFDGGLPVLARGLTLASALALGFLSLYTVHLSMKTNSAFVAARSSGAHQIAANEIAFQPSSSKDSIVYVLDRVSYAPKLDETTVLSF
ncbi:MAG: hypothetical protein IT578_10000 [Verrucomicrobiae bacterium]|nr:hypothetical protein [Verrucomicrobiae bacterium]